jgi:hypothetical protein
LGSGLNISGDAGGKLVLTAWCGFSASSARTMPGAQAASAAKTIGWRRT